MLLWNRSWGPVQGPVYAGTHRGKKTFVLLWKIPLSCGKGIWFVWKATASKGELRWDIRSVTQPSWAALQMFLEIVLHLARWTSHAAAKYSSSAQNGLHCSAIKVKYYPSPSLSHKQTPLRVKASRGRMTSWNPRGKANTTPAPCVGRPLRQDRDLPLWDFDFCA